MFLRSKNRTTTNVLQGEREDAVDWRPSLNAVRITPAQAAAIVDARAQVTLKIEECGPAIPTFHPLLPSPLLLSRSLLSAVLLQPASSPVPVLETPASAAPEALPSHLSSVTIA